MARDRRDNRDLIGFFRMTSGLQHAGTVAEFLPSQGTEDSAAPTLSVSSAPTILSSVYGLLTGAYRARFRSIHRAVYVTRKTDARKAFGVIRKPTPLTHAWQRITKALKFRVAVYPHVHRVS